MFNRGSQALAGSLLPGGLWLTALVAVPLLSFGAISAQAASPDNTAPQAAPQQAVPQGDLNAHQGVIAPPATGDTAINKGAPSPQQFPTPVIHPPKSTTDPSTVPQKE